MKAVFWGSVFTIYVVIAGCVKEFYPEINQTPYNVVIDGLITDQPEIYTINLFWSDPINEKTNKPMSGCEVTVHDDLGNVFFSSFVLNGLAVYFLGVLKIDELLLISPFHLENVHEIYFF